MTLVKGPGLTLLELLIVLSVLAIVAGIAALDVRPLYDPLQDSLARSEGYLKNVRAKAMATTSAYQVILEGNKLKARYASRCSSDLTFTTDPQLVQEYPSGITVLLSPADAFVCFTSRGTLVFTTNTQSFSGNPQVQLRDSRGRVARLELLLGGGVVRR
ncbi:prepilin-type N-terminal cleavage/methylation domain-containing protein [Thermus albus]|uniref:prepilin-type N-terminal cleavage/methylation domain-containing protein n=1 Tax=Thermus albus TaxID=2908146 RepID=UPI003C12C526